MVARMLTGLIKQYQATNICAEAICLQALLPCELLLGLGNWNTIATTNGCASMCAASHWTWLTVPAAILQQAQPLHNSVRQ